MSDRNFILAISAIHLITVVPACLSGLALAISDVKLSHPSILPWDTIVMTIILMSLSLLALVQVW